MRIVYLGTPDFAVPTLEALHRAGHQIVAVYTQPDRPKGRGQEIAAPPVKEAAFRLHLPVHQPEKIRTCLDELASFSPDIMVVVGYGQIIPQNIIDLPRLGIVNVHASLLPKYRGAAPIQWAIANGERTTGVTTMQINEGLDTGAILLKAETPIDPKETAPELSARLATLGADLCVETLRQLEAGTLSPTPQDPALATLAPILTKNDGRLDWNWPAPQIHNHVRGLQPWPGCFSRFRGQPLNIWRTALGASDAPTGLSPGELFLHRRRLFVGTGGNATLELLEVQPPGKKRMHPNDFANGVRLEPNESLS